MVLAVVDDLLFSSRIRSVAGAAGRPVTFIRRSDAVLAAVREQAPSLVLVDLDRDTLDPIGVIRAIRATTDIAQPRIVGFGSHVHVERLQNAKAAGCDQAMARSGFVAALPALVAGASVETLESTTSGTAAANTPAAANVATPKPHTEGD